MNAPLSRQILRAPEHRSQVAAPQVQRSALSAAPASFAGLRVSSPHDAAEHEATRVAARVVSMPAGAVSASAARFSGLVPPSAQRSAAVPAPAGGGSAGLPSGGQPLPRPLRDFMEPRFGADFSAVRIHTGPQAAQASRQLNAAAFTVGHQVFFGAGAWQPDSGAGRELIAHELTHTIQQGAAPQVQRSPLAIQQHGSPSVQRLGVADALDYFAEQANLLPGFRLFTLVLGANPINLRAVDRSAANLLRAVVELLPGGALITRALDAHGIVDRVAGWVQQQIGSLGLVAGSIRQAVDRFLGSLGWRDIFRLGDVWERARRIVTEPIARITAFVGNLASGVLQFIRDAVLRPLAGLAQGTRGWGLLCAVLGRNPITGEAVPRTAETLLGGFMRLIGQEEVWQNVQRGNAVGRAWAWFQGALGGLMEFVAALPGLFMDTLRSLGIADLVSLPQTFARIGRVFGDFAGRFVTWAGRQVMSLLEIVFEVVAPAVMPYLRRAAGALRTIIADPVRFIGHLVRAGVQGLRQFAGNIVSHLRASLIGWLTGAMGGAGVYVPQAFTLPEIIKFVLSVLGLTWQALRGKLVRMVGETAVTALETGFDIVVTLVRDGPAAAWERIRESLSNLREMVMEQIMSFVRDNIVSAAITRLVSSLNPAGAFIQAIIATYNTVMFFIERMRQIGQVAAALIDSIAAIASGAIGAAANRVEQTLAGLLTLAISFLARLVGLGRVSDAVTAIINRIRAPIDRALDRVVEWIVAMARRIGRLFSGGTAAAPAAAAAPAPGVRGEAARLLQQRLGSHQTPEQARQVVRQVLDQLRPAGLRNLLIVPGTPETGERIEAEASPRLPLLRLLPRGLIPPGRSVTMVARVTLDPGPAPATPAPGSVTPLPAAERGAQVRGSALVPFGSGGAVLASGGAQILDVASWNTGRLNETGNTSHAEHQFIHHMEGRNRRERGFFGRIAGLELNLRNYSPCTVCVDELSGFLRDIRAARAAAGTPAVQARIAWTEAYPGGRGGLQATTTQSLGTLSGAGWTLAAPASGLPPNDNAWAAQVHVEPL